jgi:hypothetical protein
MSCDPTWEVCDDSTTMDPAPTSTDDSSDSSDPATTSSSKMPLIYAGFSLWMVIAAGLTTNSFNGWITDVIAAKVTNNTAWTTSYMTGADPVSSWFTAAYTQSSLHFGMVVWFGLNQVLGNNGGLVNMLFYRFAQLSLIFPLIDLGLTFRAKNGYKKCGDLTITQFDKTTTGVTQYVSCTDGTDALFGDTGTTAAKINNDPSMTWFITNMTSSVLMFLITGKAVGAIGANYKSNQACTDDSGAVTECPADDSAASTSDDSDSSTPPADMNDDADDVWWL